MTAHGACPISQLSFTTVLSIGGSRREGGEGMSTGSPTMGEGNKKFWMIAFDACCIKSFRMTELFIDISEGKR